MIDNLTIQNFRLFESLEVKGIKQVNLIVGRNNAGKSALLEALQLYFGRFSLVIMLDVLKRRQETINLTTITNKHLHNSYLKNICKGRIFPFQSEDKLLISSDGHYSYEMMLIKREGEGYTPITKEDFFTAYNDSINVYIGCKYNNQVLSVNSIPIERVFDEASIRDDIFWSVARGAETTANYVSTNGLSDSYANELWESISLLEAGNEVIKAFHIIEPKITGLNFRAGVPIIKLNDMSEPIPLKSLGDGMTRLFHIILSLVTAKDGVLLIDEFENGLHWSTQTKAWELIFILAKQWNVQVFCTTHSKDCINSFEDVWTQNPEDAAFFRLYRKENQSHIKAYDLEMLSDAIETETEVR